MHKDVELIKCEKNKIISSDLAPALQQQRSLISKFKYCVVALHVHKYAWSIWCEDKYWLIMQFWPDHFPSCSFGAILCLFNQKMSVLKQFNSTRIASGILLKSSTRQYNYISNFVIKQSTRGMNQSKWRRNVMRGITFITV